MTFAPLLLSLALAADPVGFVAVAPGYPGTTAEAQPSMDRFASALAAQAGWPAGSITATYVEKDGPGVERLRRPGPPARAHPRHAAVHRRCTGA